MSYSSWSNNWNLIIRNVIFPDTYLKLLMEVPVGTNILDFIDKYFIRAGFTNSVLTNQAVRIIYADVASHSTNAYGVNRQLLSFDIYVKTTLLHNYGNDRLALRTNLIANRIVLLLTKNRYIYSYRFWVSGLTDLGTSAIGYSRHNISFNYMKSY